MAAKYFAMLNSRALELLSFTVQLVEHRTVIAGSWIRFPLKTRNFYGLSLQLHNGKADHVHL